MKGLKCFKFEWSKVNTPF